MTTSVCSRRTVLARTVLAAAIAAIGLGGATQGLADPVDMQVVDRETGQTLQLWRHHGRLYVAGRPGARYSLRVTNNTEGRVLVVMSVDGVNILTGETAGYDQRGYIFSPHETYDVSGWRKSNTEVAAFAFAAQRQSYAARTGRPADVGVIGMAVFNELAPPPPPEPEAWLDRLDRRNEAYSGPLSRPAAPGKAMPAPPAASVPSQRGSSAGALADQSAQPPALRREEKLGTAHGAREWSVVDVVPFQRASSRPWMTRQIEYDTWANLAAAGVIPTPRYPPPRPHPRPFPQDPDGAGYVPDPPDGL